MLTEVKIKMSQVPHFKANTHWAIDDQADHIFDRSPFGMTGMYSFNTNRRYNWPIVAPIKIKPVQSSLSYQKKKIGVVVNRLVGMGL